MSITRRKMLKASFGMTALTAGTNWQELLASTQTPKFKIGACDWSLGRIHQVEALALAKQLNLDGVQVSLGSIENHIHLTHPEVQQQYLDASKEYQVAISGLAIGELNSVPYKSDPRTDEWVRKSIGVAKNLECRVVLLAFFGKGDLKGDSKGTKNVIEKLKRVAPLAEEQDIVLGIESWLSAEEHVEIIESVGSSHVMVYYDVANSNKMGYNIYQEIRALGTKYICEFHAKENGHLLGKGKIDFSELRKAVDDIGYSGWFQIEGATPEGADIIDSYRSNVKLMRSKFPS